MDNKEIAEQMVDGFMAGGSEPGAPCKRVQFMLDNGKGGERAGGGFIRQPLIDEFADLLAQIIPTFQSPALDAPDSPGQWWCWREGAKGELCVDVIFDLDRPVVRYFSGCYLLKGAKGEWEGLKWRKVERPVR